MGLGRERLISSLGGGGCQCECHTTDISLLSDHIDHMAMYMCVCFLSTFFQGLGGICIKNGFRVLGYGKGLWLYVIADVYDFPILRL